MVVFELSLGVPNGKGEKGILSQQNGTHKVLEGQRVCFFIEGHRGLPQQETRHLSVPYLSTSQVLFLSSSYRRRNRH